MNTDISPENEQFIQFAIAKGDFQDRRAALDEAVALLKRRQQLLDHIDEGMRQLRDGEFDDFDFEELQKFFEQVQVEGRSRFEASRGACWSA
ncbi:MAG TPA: hypothetical protein VND64_18325 [Pirellulales bacterium]|nr:hypothetical protein [Pirellulales bacterium]